MTLHSKSSFIIESFSGILLKSKKKIKEALNKNNKKKNGKLNTGNDRIVTIGACIEADAIYVVLEIKKVPKQDSSKLVTDLKLTLS